MKAFDWTAISVLLAATAMAAARTEATTTAAEAWSTTERGMDVVVATATRPAGGLDAAGPAAAAATATEDGAPANSPAPRLGIGMPSRSELLARARETAREAIENLEISLEKPDKRF